MFFDYQNFYNFSCLINFLGLENICDLLQNSFLFFNNLGSDSFFLFALVVNNRGSLNLRNSKRLFFSHKRYMMTRISNAGANVARRTMPVVMNRIPQDLEHQRHYATRAEYDEFQTRTGISFRNMKSGPCAGHIAGMRKGEDTKCQAFTHADNRKNDDGTLTKQHPCSGTNLDGQVPTNDNKISAQKKTGIIETDAPMASEPLTDNQIEKMPTRAMEIGLTFCQIEIEAPEKNREYEKEIHKRITSNSKLDKESRGDRYDTYAGNHIDKFNLDKLNEAKLKEKESQDSETKSSLAQILPPEITKKKE